MKLFLDDIRSLDMVYPNSNLNEWVIVRNYYEFINYINKYGLPKFISFDHDLGVGYTEEKTGYDAAKWLVDYCFDNKNKMPEYSVHSQNPVGVENIINYLKNAEKHLGVNK